MHEATTEVSVEEAKANLETLIERAANGERIVIACPGTVKVDLTAHVGNAPTSKTPENDSTQRMKAFRKGRTLGGIDWRELRDEGRR